jgi:hypothetical protein
MPLQVDGFGLHRIRWYVYVSTKRMCLLRLLWHPITCIYAPGMIGNKRY